MRTKTIKNCQICGKPYIIFIGKGRKPSAPSDSRPVRPTTCLTCSQTCSKEYSKRQLQERRALNGSK